MSFTAFLLSAACAVAPCDEGRLAERLPDLFARSAAHYRVLEARAVPLMHDAKGVACTPHGWNAQTGALDMRDIYWWTSGHFPGSLWLLFEATGDTFWRDRARTWTELLKPVANYDGNHDIGFMTYCSFGNGARLLDDGRYDAILLRAAQTLATRFHDGLGLLRSWGGKDDRKSFLVIPDNLMNLELLMWASKHGGGARPGEIARSHASVTMRHHFRPDGGTFHVLNYDQETGRILEYRRGQGASCETAWSRGQSWAIYGYTMMYRETGDRTYLDFACKVSDFAIGNPNMPEDGVPLWDYGAPGEERDTSAASVMADGLLELSTFIPGEKGAAYRAFAVRQLAALAGPAYYAEPGENGEWLLKHGVGHKPVGSEVDTPLDYGDYYFLEALLRLQKLHKKGKLN